MSESKKITQHNISRSRRWLFMLIITVFFPLVLLLVLELGLRMMNYGYPTDFFIERQIEGERVYANNVKFTWRFFPEELARPSCNLAIPAQKPSNTVRIVILGGSAAMGDPDFSFGVSRVLETMLCYHYPDRQFEVINAAITAINSNVVVTIAENCRKLVPDIMIVYLGNNEVIGPYGPGTVFSPFLSSLSFIRTSIYLKSTRIGQLITNLRRRFQPTGDAVQTWGGVDMFIENRLRHDDERMRDVYDHFYANLDAICKIGLKAGARVILSTVATNVADCAPFASLHRQDFVKIDAEQWEELYDAGIEFESLGRFGDAVKQYKKAMDLDDSFAELHYRLARCYLKLNRNHEAMDHYIKARDLDALRFRADSRINNIIHEIAAENTDESIALLDAEKLLGEGSIDGIDGEDFFYDHVHLNFKGNYRLAGFLKGEIENMLTLDDERGPVISEAEIAERMAFTLWDRYRIETEILGRMKSPAFAGRLDNERTIQSWTVKVDSLAAHMGSGALTDAIECYRNAIKLNDKDWVLRNNLGLVLLESGTDPDGAIVQFRHVLTLFPSDHSTHNNIGLAYAQQDSLDQAIACYQEALRIRPGYFKANFNMGEALERQGKFDEALDYFEKAHLSDQEMASIYHRIGKQIAAEGDVNEAIGKFEEAIRTWPPYYEAHHDLGNLAARTDNIDLAVQHLKEAIAIKPEEVAGQIDLASVLFKMGDYRHAAEHYKQALLIRSDLPEVYNNLGLALYNQGEFEQAVEQFRRALNFNEDFLAARNNLAGALSRLGRSDEAIAQLKQLLLLDPNNPNSYNNIGAEFLKIGEIESAIVYFKKALKLNPNLSSAQRNLNYALSRLEESGGHKSLESLN